MADAVAQTPPALHAPSDKERKYDRQLRLWAASGQAALESANILLVNSGCGTVGVETLKNLVLPGIGRFTIADEAVVGDGDLGVNFFLDESCRGKSRARCCTRLLQELNPEVSGDWHPKSDSPMHLRGLLDSSDAFTIILYTLPLKMDQVDILTAYAREHHIPLIAVHSVGFYSYFSTRLPGTFPVVETHPEEAANADLRLLNPWPELAEFASDMTRDMDSLDDHDHGHLPLVVILLHYLSVWRKSHGNFNPTSYEDKVAFRGLIAEAMRRNNPEGGEENFDEAVAAVMKLVTSHPLPGSLRQVFDHRDQSEDQCQSTFWTIAQAVKQFYEKYQELPLAGALPDMKAKSDVYVKLQCLYKDKARRDALQVFATVRAMTGGDQVELTEVELFCKNARFIKLVNAVEGPSMEQVIESELANDEAAAIPGVEMPRSLMPLYMALTATSNVATATAEEIVASIAQRAPALAKNDRVAQVAEEVSRAAGGELHNISAMTGGMVAQEVIKVITRQYIPIENTCVLDGIESRCQVLRL
ncbi:thiF family protein [Hirsutella rhossiliensis]|uniref:NEDD8-activating enzyme E1 regulatory subunit n=1 Tax=Hirsutella rhossiliensis TaxID=111463 RepID=A0A9P8MSM4_9HYPO|nr:thiF family domain-containing protein [Hirsutella rhossiliensis]KAH0960322.1 thiF family domain-containing protein [Hirsutella rhossiliensis]